MERDDQRCLRAVFEADLRLWAADERRDASNDFAARHEACVGAEWIADQIASAGVTTLFEAMGVLFSDDGAAA